MSLINEYEFKIDSLPKNCNHLFGTFLNKVSFITDNFFWKNVTLLFYQGFC